MRATAVLDMTRFSADLTPHVGQTVTVAFELRAELGNFDLLLDRIHLE
jgi:hypothetical protein